VRKARRRNSDDEEEKDPVKRRCIAGVVEGDCE
jgi:hypothetical protein